MGTVPILGGRANESSLFMAFKASGTFELNLIPIIFQFADIAKTGAAL